MSTAEFRFYEELNDFLPREHRRRTIYYAFTDSPGIKDPIEAIGVPHTEIELIVVNGRSVGFDYRLQDRDRVAVFPVFESFDVTSLVRLRDAPLRRTAFVLDVNLGKLARRLRLCGFDAAYRNDYRDREVVNIGVHERRIILTRDRRLLHHRDVSHGYWVRASDPDSQLTEVLQRFDLLRQVRPFRRCTVCNGGIEPVSRDAVLDQLEPLTRRYYREFYRCRRCRKVYWKGSHYENMMASLTKLTDMQPRGQMA